MPRAYGGPFVHVSVHALSQTGLFDPEGGGLFFSIRLEVFSRVSGYKTPVAEYGMVRTGGGSVAVIVYGVWKEITVKEGGLGGGVSLGGGGAVIEDVRTGSGYCCVVFGRRFGF